MLDDLTGLLSEKFDLSQYIIPYRKRFGGIKGEMLCGCLEKTNKKGRPRPPILHRVEQDTNKMGWLALSQYIDDMITLKGKEFKPGLAMPWAQWSDVVTLPSSISKLTHVNKIELYSSNLYYFPPEIGQFQKLKHLGVYRNYNLHWMPYEVTRCKMLEDSVFSTRALYGNRNTRLPFPKLTKAMALYTPETCSVCDRAFEGFVEPFWITLRVGTDHLPLLVHSCSADCTKSLPTPPKGFYQKPHKGGEGVGMPDKT